MMLEITAQIRIIDSCGKSLAEVLQGNLDPLELLFPRGELDQCREVYEGSGGHREASTANRTEKHAVEENDRGRKEFRSARVPAVSVVESGRRTEKDSATFSSPKRATSQGRIASAAKDPYNACVVAAVRVLMEEKSLTEGST